VALLARRAVVFIEHLVDEDLDCSQFRLGAILAVVQRWQRTRNCPASDPPMDTEFCCHTRDRAYPKLMLPTELLKQIHFGFPVRKRPPIQSREP